ncbi:RDD family protein [Actinomadura sp. LOL_016]|uniref:RDD family protein n=1 Tax=unclassified Actinomadura TaxID=2626254 RepID=UPI003A80249B
MQEYGYDPHRTGAAGGSPEWYMPPENTPAAWLPPGETGTDLDLAGAGRRLAARLIDQAIVAAVILGVVFTVLPLTYEENAYGENETPLAVGLSLAAFGIACFYLCEALQLVFWGRTLGKCLLKTRVAGADEPDEPLTPFRAMGRALAYPLFWSFAGSVIGVFALVNLLWTLWDRPLRQCLHDKMARTVVLRDRHPSRRASQIAVMTPLALVPAVAAIVLATTGA